MFRQGKWGGVLAAFCAAGLAAACADVGDGTDNEEGTAEDAIRYVGDDEPIRLPAAGKPIVAVTQAGVLSALEDRGFSLNAVMARALGATPAPKVNNQALYDGTRWYRAFADGVAQDLDAERRRADASASPRAFDYGYLRAASAKYDLVAVVNRHDRAAVEPEGCGELRFVYRLRYSRSATSSSRLPLTLNVVWAAPRGQDGCRSLAQRWVVPTSVASPAAYIDWIATSAASAQGYAFRQLEVNAQAVRYPSEAEPELGGAASYILRVYTFAGEAPQLAPLENTPDVAKIRADAGLRRELLATLRDNVAAIDAGTFRLPAKFLATRTVSFSTHGPYRMVNRPFSSLLRADELELAPAAFGQAKVVGSAAGLLARLDDSTCAGCHQGASVAGFHVVGLERLTQSHPLNATRVAVSPHFNLEEPWRKAYVAAVAAGQTPSAPRPVSFLEARAGAGMHCVPGGAASAFKTSYGCEAGLTCREIERNPAAPVAIGTCVHTEPGPTLAGEPCYGGVHTSAADPAKDRLALSGPTHPNCLAPVQGTPGGLVTRQCGPRFPASDRSRQPRPGEVCAYNGGAGFDACADSGDFSTCLGDPSTFSRGLRGACDDDNPCRDDYICQRFFAIEGRTARAASGPGFCVPTYFLFQMRVDGHPDSQQRWLR